MYKEIFRWVIAIISQPAKAWVLLAKKGEKQEEFLSRFVYPLIGFVTVAAFLGVLFTRKEFDLELALKSSIRTLVSSFGGFYLGAYLMNEIWQGIFKREKDLKLWLRFVGYSSSLMFALNIVLMLLPEFFFLRIFILYTFYIVLYLVNCFSNIMTHIFVFKLYPLCCSIGIGSRFFEIFSRFCYRC